jgi:hypothetical protein
MPHKNPAGELVIPPPAWSAVWPTVPDRTYIVPNVAVTAVAAFIVTTQVPVPEHPPPDHPLKNVEVPSCEVKVTGVPTAKSAEQDAVQSIPDGLLVTLPPAGPLKVSVRVRLLGVQTRLTAPEGGGAYVMVMVPAFAPLPQGKPASESNEVTPEPAGP